MNEHEELLEVLLGADDAHKPEGAMWPELATAILAGGYHRGDKSRVITDAAETDALPDGTVVLDKFGDVMQYRGGLWCGYETAPCGSERAARKYGPLIVLHTPEAIK